MKVFLSQSTKDQQFVQALAAELETEKIETWLCEVDIEFGQNFVAKIEEGLRNADLNSPILRRCSPISVFNGGSQPDVVGTGIGFIFRGIEA
jgi:TIR domain